MYPLSGITVCFLALLAVVAAEQPIFKRRVSNAQRRTEAATIPAAEFSFPIAGSAPRSKAKRTLLKYLRNRAGASFTTPIAGSDFDEEYLLNATVGGQKFSLIIDTGSSDTWVAVKGFSCFDLSGTPEPADTCAFGTNGFDPSKSRTFKSLPDTNFNITYGDGEFLTGGVGFDTIQVGGLAVKSQEIGLVDKAAWLGDGINTGLMGLAWPNLTSVYEGTDPDQDQFPETQLPYNSIFFTAVQEKLVSNPFFSVALDRGSFQAENSSLFDPNLGFISFGGIAPVPVTHTAVTVPVQGYDSTTFLPANGPQVTYFFYTVDVQSFSFPGSRGLASANNNTILDTGTTLNYIPTELADAFNAAFKPPAVFDDDFGIYVTTCNAQVPPFTVTIGGQSFSVDAADQLLPLGIKDDKGRDLCASGTNDGGPLADGNIFILGDTFLHNVVTTFNIQTHEITITQRQPYKSNSPRQHLFKTRSTRLR